MTANDIDAIRAQRDRLVADLTDAGNEVDLLTAELAKVRAQLTAANHHTDNLAADVRDMQKANTAYANENARLRSKLADQQPVIDAAKAWVGSSVADFGRTGDALTDAVERLNCAACRAEKAEVAR